MRFSVGYDLGGFFSGLGAEGRHLSYSTKPQRFTKHVSPASSLLISSGEHRAKLLDTYPIIATRIT